MKRSGRKSMDQEKPISPRLECRSREGRGGFGRARKVLPTFNGVAIVDGWKSYRYFSILQRCWAHPLREAFVSKLNRASKDLFTFILYSGVEPTNNHAERQLREPIVRRKIRGWLKSEKGIVTFSRLMTAVSTWKLQDLNPFVEFRRCL